MSHLAQLPVWAAVVVAALVTLGSALTLLGTIGLVRLPSFYDRIHAPTLGTSWGTAATMLASALLFTLTGERLVIHEVVIGALIMITTPVTMMILGRAALLRDVALPQPAGQPAVVARAAPDADPAGDGPEAAR